MPQEIKIPLDFQDVGKIVNLPDGADPQDAATVHQLTDLEASIGGNINGSGKYLISGGAVWSGTGLTYNVSSISYFWNGDQVADPTSVTLAVSDPTNNRLDAVVVNEAGDITVITGDPSASPITPAIPEDQLLIQFILVEAGTTEPVVTQENIYLDNAEWTFSNYTISGTQVGTSNPDATDSPKEGTKCIDNSLDPRTGIRFGRATSLDITPYTTLEVWVRYPVAMAGNQNLYVQFEDTSFAPIGTRVDLFNYGVQKSVLNTWQLALVPIGSFGVTTVQGFRMILSGGKNNVQVEWDLDFITLLDGNAPIVTSPTINFYKDSVRVASQKGLDMVAGTGMVITAVEDALKETVKYTLTPDTNKAYVDAADATLLSAIGAKEDAITPGTTSQYWRGDKTWQAFDSAVLASSLAGLSITGGAVTSSDNVLAAFGKLQNQINGILGGATYQGVWDASTNSPSLASGVGTKGNYYVVSVAGSTSLDGITDWKVGDWAIFNGTTWDKVDNTDAVSSVNGAIGAISLAGTADRISVSGTTFDIASTYAGQASITTVGTIGTGVWQGTPVALGYGGTGFSTYAKGDVIYASAINTLSKLAATTDGYVLTLASGLPVWAAASGGTSLPSQTGNAGKYLTTDGTTASWGLLTGWVLGGNTTGGTATIGTNDNFNLIVKTNNVTAFTVTTSGGTIYGNGNTPSKEYIYFRNIGSNGANVGIGLNSVYGMGFFTGTNQAAFTWIAGGISGTNMMTLNSSGLSVVGGLTLSSSITGLTSLSVSGKTTSGGGFDCGGSFNVVKMYWRNLGTGSNSGVAFVAGVATGVQNFCKNSDNGWLWTYGGDMQTGTTNEQMRLVGSGLNVLNGVLVGISAAATIDASALLEVRSTTKCFLPSRMTTTQKIAITSPASGSIMFDTDLQKLCVKTATGWETITSS